MSNQVPDAWINSPELYVSIFDSPLGPVWIASMRNALVGLYFDGQRYFPDRLTECESRPSDNELVSRVTEQLREYFDGDRVEFDLPIRLYGTEFQRSVWSALLTIPYGETRTYAQVAALVGKSNAFSRAIGMAVGRNPISLILPCHRVVGSNGGLTGYAGGIDRKQELLKLEKRGSEHRDSSLESTSIRPMETKLIDSENRNKHAVL